MRYLLSLAALAALTAALQAHFVFVYVEGGDAKLVFGHGATPDPKLFPSRAEKTALTARDAAGKDTKLTAEKGDGNYFRAKLGGTPAVVFGVNEAGVTQRGDNPPVLSWDYPKAIVGDPFAAGTEVGKALPLELVPVRDGDKVRVKVLAAGKPVSGVEVTVGLPGKGEDKAEAVKTDAAGLTPSFADRGRYCVAARKLDETPGESGGKKYTAVRHTASLVFDFGGSK